MSNSIKTVHKGKALTLKLEKATYPDGDTETLEIIRHPGGSATVAVNKRKEVCLIHQFRYAAGGWLWEIPAGRIEHKEDPLDTAKRELAEEAGLIAYHWKSLTSIFPSPGICDERIYLYMASELSETKISHEDTEYIEIHWLPIIEAIKWVKTGKIKDAKTIIALFYVNVLLAEAQ